MTVKLGKVDKNAPFLRHHTRLSKPQVDVVLTRPAFGIDAAPAKFTASAFSYMIDGSIFSSLAQTALLFSAVHVVTNGGFGAIGVYADKAGGLSTFVPGATQTTAQNYATEALALAALAALAPQVGKVLVGIFTIKSVGADFTANTTALNAAALTNANLIGIVPDRRWTRTNIGNAYQVLSAVTHCNTVAGVVSTEVAAMKQSSAYNTVLVAPFLEVDRRTVSNVSVNTLRFGGFGYQLDGVTYRANAQGQLAFSAAHVVTLGTFGAIMLLIDSAAVYSTLIGEATQTTAMAYATAALARAALPAVPAGKLCIGILVVEAGVGAWTANTNNIVAGSDLTAFQLLEANINRRLSNVTLAIDAVTTKFQSTVAFDTVFNGMKVTKAPATAITFTAAHQITALNYVAILVGMNNAGVVSTLVPRVLNGSQTATQGFATVDLAVAALPTPNVGDAPIGYIVIQAAAGTFIANTNDLVAGSGVTSIVFHGLTSIEKVSFTKVGVVATPQNQLFPISGAPFAVNVPTRTLATNDIFGARGQTADDMKVLLGCSVDAVATDLRVVVVTRPWSAAGDA